MPLEELALCVLERLADDEGPPGQRPLRTGRINTWVVEWDRAEGHRRETNAEALLARASLGDAVSEAWDWLRVEGCLAQAASPSGNLEAYFVTRRGRELLDHPDPIGLIRAQRRLGVELHHGFATRLRPLVQAGAFEQAALDALRLVEGRVRELAGTPRDQRGQALTGVVLMHHAFGHNGKLADPVAESGERLGLMELFSGAFGAVRNPLAHRNIEWDDPSEAAEMVLLADLLMRQLDRVEARLTVSDPAAGTTASRPPR
jgi:uncharacterized protein (TIGR02391 family)